ncbi:hypothetical protein TrVE_jg7787 [Triparma verrucosa]|uniref:Glutamine cyclotransferase n=1 Tax=Triparma verrucosa TaxID=1606542 RepID=A0A9W7BSU6_9STRA|nr:hypothetical protein TrVE_jg7787 [Triparma verrucosa]
MEISAPATASESKSPSSPSSRRSRSLKVLILATLAATLFACLYIKYNPNAQEAAAEKALLTPTKPTKEPTKEPTKDPSKPSPPITTHTKGYTLLSTFPHSRDSFTQGLFYSSTNRLIESCGLYGKSSIREIDLNTGSVIKSNLIEEKYFAEGVAEGKDGRFVMLTWKEKTGLYVDSDDLTVASKFNYRTHTGEGWGITNLGDDYVVSDGSDWLFVWDGVTMEEKRRFRVRMSDGKYVRFLNELEFYKGDILANIWYSDIIIRIDVETGIVKTIYDFKTLWPSHERSSSADCFNGIAVLDDDVLMVTGKLWPKMYKVKLDD